MIIKIQTIFEHTPRPLDLSNSKIAIKSRIKMIKPSTPPTLDPIITRLSSTCTPKIDWIHKRITATKSDEYIFLLFFYVSNRS